MKEIMDKVKKQSLQVVYAANDAYAKLAGISMISLFETNSEEEEIEVYLLSDGISILNKEKVQSIGKKYKRKIIICDIEKKMSELSSTGVTGYANAIGKGLTAYGRIFIEEFLPEDIKRVVYFDCDIMVNGQISTLLELDMNGKAIGLAYDCLRNEYKKVIDFPLEAPYYNSGVMLIDMSVWKNHRCSEKIQKHLEMTRKSYPLVDQDVINCALREEIVPLDVKYNFLSQLFLYDYYGYERVYKLKASYWFSKEEFEREEAVIYHFCGQTFLRPWYANSKHPMKEVYDKYYYMSPWGDEKQAKMSWKTQYLIQYLSYLILPDKLAIFIGTVMQRAFIKFAYDL